MVPFMHWSVNQVNCLRDSISTNARLPAFVFRGVFGKGQFSDERKSFLIIPNDCWDVGGVFRIPNTRRAQVINMYVNELFVRGQRTQHTSTPHMPVQMQY